MTSQAQATVGAQRVDPPPARLRMGLLGAGSGVYVYLFGQVYLSEIVLVALLPLIFLGWNRSGRSLRDVRPVLLALTAWLIGLVLGGLLVASSTTGATVQYVAGAIVTMITVAVVHRLIKSRDELLALLFGFGIGQLLTVVVQGSALTEFNAWKFGAGTGIVVMLLCVIRRGRWAPIVLALSALVSLVYDTRSLALIALATLALGLVTDVLGRRVRPASLALIFLIVLGAVGALVSLLYSYVIRSGVLGASATLKYDAQGHGSPLLVLLGGRDEIFFSLRSIVAHPWLGLGTSPRLSFDAATAGFAQMADLGLQPAVPADDQPGAPLPVHSYLFGGWAYAGVLGLLCWVVIFVFVFRRALYAAINVTEHRYLVLYLGMYALWNILYSPYGGTGRFQLAVSLLALDVMVRYGRRTQIVDEAGPASIDAHAPGQALGRAARSPGSAGTARRHAPRPA